MVYFAAASLIVAMIGLSILLFASFAPQADQPASDGFIIKGFRKIRARPEKEPEEKPKENQPNPKFILLVKTIIIGEAVGLFFLALTSNPTKFQILFVNSIILFGASFFCSVLTLFNVWLKKQTNIQFRIIVQVITLILGIILMNQAFKGIAITPDEYFLKIVYNSYYLTVVVAIITMLLNVISGNKSKTPEFNFSNYLLVVVVSGLVIGTFLYYLSSHV